MQINVMSSILALVAASVAFAPQTGATALALSSGAGTAAELASSAPASDPKQLKQAEAEARKLQREHEAAERKRLADLHRLYGEGPYPDEIAAYLTGKPEVLQPLYKALFTGGERNAVLNFERLGLAAMDQGSWQDAEFAFDGGLARIEAVYAHNKQAEAARSLFHNEANKDFKGEPYERAMAYYYRGLLYLRSGDFDNARASFKSAEYQSTVTEAETFQNQFAVMDWLVGWTYHCQDASSSAAEAFATAHTALPVLVAPAPGDTTLLLAELGRGPVKERDGTQAQKLVFKPGPGDGVSGASFDLAGQSAVPGVEAANITFQATTRGGRAIDGIQDGKASFKETTGAIGQVATQTSLMNLAGGDTSGSNMGMAVAGMLFSMFSSAAKTQADIRGWDNLPDRIVLASAKTDSTSAPIKIRFTTSTAPSSAEAAPLMNGSAGKCAIAWSRSTTSAGLSPATPGEDAGVAAAVARKSAVQAKDKAFRIALSGAGGAKQLASGGGS